MARTIEQTRATLKGALKASLSVTTRAAKKPAVTATLAADRTLLADVAANLTDADIAKLSFGGAPEVSSLLPISLSLIGGAVGSISLAAGVFTLTCNGAGALWGISDRCAFASTQMPGDAWLRARLDEHGGAADWDKAVVMMRASLAPDAPYVAFILFRKNGWAVETRSKAGVQSTNVFGAGVLRAGTCPQSVLAYRSGAKAFLALSFDGAVYDVVASAPLEGGSAHFGFAACCEQSITIKASNLIYGVGPVPATLVRAATTGNINPSLVPNFSAVAIGSTQVTLTWGTASDPDGSIAGYRVRVDGVLQPQVDAATHSSTISGLTSLATYGFTVSAVDNMGAEGPQTVSAQVTLPATAGSAAYPTLPAGQFNANGGTRDYKLQPFRSDADANVALGSQGVYVDAKINGVPEMGELNMVGGIYRWQHGGVDSDYGYMSVTDLHEVGCEDDPTAPLVNLYDHTFRVDAGIDASNPVSNKEVPTGGVVAQLHISTNLVLPANDQDGIFSGISGDGRYGLGLGYVTRKDPGGIITAFLDNGRTPVVTDLAGDGLSPGGSHVTGHDSRFGLLLDGDLIDVSAGGRGSPPRVMALNLRQFYQRQSPGANVENRKFPSPLQEMLNQFTGEFSSAGQDNPNRFTSPNVYSVRLALPPSFDLGVFQTRPAFLLGVTMQDWGGEHVDSSGGGAPVMFYGIKTATRSFQSRFQAQYGFQFQGSNYLTNRTTTRFKNRHHSYDAGSFPTPLQVAFADDMDLLIRGLHAVINAGPVGVANGGTDANGNIGNYGNGLGGGGPRRRPDAPT